MVEAVSQLVAALLTRLLAITFDLPSLAFITSYGKHQWSFDEEKISQMGDGDRSRSTHQAFLT